MSEREECLWPTGSFGFHDEPGEHDPCYVVFPDGAMVAVNHHARTGVDIARAKFIVAACNAALAVDPQSIGPAHIDDFAVDRFAAAMKAKLAKKRAEGFSGWNDECRVEFLSRKLREHVEKGDPIDVANFCMMLHQRGSAITPPDGWSEAECLARRLLGLLDDPDASDDEVAEVFKQLNNAISLPPSQGETSE